MAEWLNTEEGRRTSDLNQCLVCQFGDRRVRHTTATGEECAHQPEPSQAEKRLIEAIDAARTELVPGSTEEIIAELDEELAFQTVQISEELTKAEQDDAMPATGSTVVQMLEQVWTAIQANHPELPDVVIVTGSGMIQKSARWGHHRPNGWHHKDQQVQADDVVTNLTTGEMFIAGETLAKGAAFTLETMLHEAAHALARVRDIQDTSRQNRWHNRAFCKLSEELGLEYAKDKADPQHGYSDVTLTPGTAEEYAELIAELDAAIRLTVALPAFLRAAQGEAGNGRGGEYIPGGGRSKGQAAGSNTGNLKLTCLCPEPNIIRASKKVADKNVIECSDCGALFRVRD